MHSDLEIMLADLLPSFGARPVCTPPVAPSSDPHWAVPSAAGTRQHPDSAQLLYFGGVLREKEK